MTAGLLSLLASGVSADSPGAGPSPTVRAFGPDHSAGMWWLLVTVDGSDVRSVRAQSVPWTAAERRDVFLEMLYEVAAEAGWHPSVTITFKVGGVR